LKGRGGGGKQKKEGGLWGATGREKKTRLHINLKHTPKMKSTREKGTVSARPTTGLLGP